MMKKTLLVTFNTVSRHKWLHVSAFSTTNDDMNNDHVHSVGRLYQTVLNINNEQQIWKAKTSTYLLKDLES